MLTYGDGVANVNVEELVRFHRNHHKLATVTAVRPPARYGALIFEGDRIVEFNEKTQTGEGWINGGFFVLEPSVIEYIKGDATHWEREPLERLLHEGQLMAHRHEGFWQCMDTLRDVRLLEGLWANGASALEGVAMNSSIFRLGTGAGARHRRFRLCRLLAR